MADRLLIVEDTKVFAQMLQTLIRTEHGIESDVVENFAQLKERLQHADAHYYAAVVDLQLPDAPHGEAVDFVVAANIPTIVFTGTADEAAEKDLWAKHISDYAHKSSSYSIEHVVWMVKRLRENRSKHVLVVDDSLSARKMMSRLLSTQRINVKTAASGEEALEVFAQHPEICLAIIDCQMDGMNGYELTAKLRNQFPEASLEILGVSSHGGRSNSARFIKAGADDFLLKPFVPEEFLCRVNRAIDRIDQYTKLKELNELKNRFLSTAAHDIRGPLSAINNAARLLLKKTWPEERKRCVLEMIESNSHDMNAMLNELLDLSVIESGELKLNCESVDFCKLVAERMQLYAGEAEAKSISIHFPAPTSQIDLKADRIKLQQAIDNLVTNAIKYSPNEGAIRVSVETNECSIVFEVEDNGPGITEEDETQLFRPFQVLSTKSSAGEKQTGLGLVIAKNIVEAHGGSIQFRNASPNGAIFTLRLPLDNSCSTAAVKMR